MSVVELLTTYDITGPQVHASEEALCQSCAHRGKSFLCLVIKKNQYPKVIDCEEYTPTS